MEVFPEFDLFPRVTRVARAIGSVLTPFPTEAPDFMSNHYRGADTEGEALQPQLPFAELGE